MNGNGQSCYHCGESHTWLEEADWCATCAADLGARWRWADPDQLTLLPFAAPTAAQLRLSGRLAEIERLIVASMRIPTALLQVPQSTVTWSDLTLHRFWESIAIRPVEYRREESRSQARPAPRSLPLHVLPAGDETADDRPFPSAGEGR